MNTALPEAVQWLQALGPTIVAALVGVQTSKMAELRVARRNARKPKPPPASGDKPAFDTEDASSGLSRPSEREKTHG